MCGVGGGGTTVVALKFMINQHDSCENVRAFIIHSSPHTLLFTTRYFFLDVFRETPITYFKL